MRKRRKARRGFENQNSIEDFKENSNDYLDSPSISPEVKKAEEFSASDYEKWKDTDIEDILKCEAEFFCQVLRRLSKELNCARNMDDLDDVISLSSKFLEASAAKEQAIACQIAVTKDIGCPCPVKKKSKCVCDEDKKERD